MCLAATISNKQWRTLLDSGSTHSFIAEAVATSLRIPVLPRSGISVDVANGDRVPCKGVCEGVHVGIGGEDFIIDLFAIP
jgi:hypothetical protein